MTTDEWRHNERHQHHHSLSIYNQLKSIITTEEHLSEENKFSVQDITKSFYRNATIVPTYLCKGMLYLKDQFSVKKSVKFYTKKLQNFCGIHGNEITNLKKVRWGWIKGLFSSFAFSLCCRRKTLKLRLLFLITMRISIFLMNKNDCRPNNSPEYISGELPTKFALLTSHVTVCIGIQSIVANDSRLCSRSHPLELVIMDQNLQKIAENLDTIFFNNWLTPTFKSNAIVMKSNLEMKIELIQRL